MPSITYSIPLGTVRIEWTIEEQKKMVKAVRADTRTMFKEVVQDVKDLRKD